MPTIEECIIVVCDDLKEFLLAKNAAYGNAAANGISVFAKNIDPLTKIHIRMDDKINRLVNGHEYSTDDTKLDLAGYLILERAIIRMRELEDETV